VDDTEQVIWEFWEQAKRKRSMGGVRRLVKETQAKLDEIEAEEEAWYASPASKPQPGDFTPIVWVDRLVDGKLVSEVINAKP